VSDHVLVAARRALFADVNLAGLTLGIRELHTERDLDEADATACAIPGRFLRRAYCPANPLPAMQDA
jgi:hypothetical protein